MENSAKIKEIFTKLGFSEALKGTAYLRDMVEHYNPEQKFMVLYFSTAKIHGVDFRQVERCARTAIGSAWKRSHIIEPEWQVLFGVWARFDAPTISEFVTKIAGCVHEN